MATPKAFSSHVSAALLTGTLAAGLALLDAAQPRPRGGLWSTLLTASVLLLVPGMSTRSPKRMLKGFLIGFLWVVGSCLVPIALLNGRLELPLTVLITPGISVIVPGISTTWRTTATLNFLCFWLFVDVVMLALRDKRMLQWRVSYPIEGRPKLAALAAIALSTAVAVLRPKLAALAAIALSTPVAVLLYRLSWVATLSGTFQRPLYSDLTYNLCLLVYVSIFPIKVCLLNCLYDTFSLKKVHDEQEREEKKLSENP